MEELVEALKPRIAGQLRIVVIGPSASGKSSLCHSLASFSGLPWRSLDDMAWERGWRRSQEFPQRVTDFVHLDGWVTDLGWGYGDVRGEILARADVCIWLDPEPLAQQGVLLYRTWLRRVRQSPIAGGNVQGPILSAFGDPDHFLRRGWRIRSAFRNDMPGLVLSLADNVLLIRVKRGSSSRGVCSCFRMLVWKDGDWRSY